MTYRALVRGSGARPQQQSHYARVCMQHLRAKLEQDPAETGIPVDRGGRGLPVGIVRRRLLIHRRRAKLISGAAPGQKWPKCHASACVFNRPDFSFRHKPFSLAQCVQWLPPPFSGDHHESPHRFVSVDFFRPRIAPGIRACEPSCECRNLRPHRTAHVAHLLARWPGYVEGRPGNEYQIVVKNRTPEDVLAVLSVDGVNVLSGQDRFIQSGAATCFQTGGRWMWRAGANPCRTRPRLLHRNFRFVRRAPGGRTTWA